MHYAAAVALIVDKPGNFTVTEGFKVTVILSSVILLFVKRYLTITIQSLA